MAALMNALAHRWAVMGLWLTTSVAAIMMVIGFVLLWCIPDDPRSTTG